jgi:hypothetical protein
MKACRLCKLTMVGAGVPLDMPEGRARVHRGCKQAYRQRLIALVAFLGACEYPVLVGWEPEAVGMVVMMGGRA